jgi:hypothetical protein
MSQPMMMKLGPRFSHSATQIHCSKKNHIAAKATIKNWSAIHLPKWVSSTREEFGKTSNGTDLRLFHCNRSFGHNLKAVEYSEKLEKRCNSIMF